MFLGRATPEEEAQWKVEQERVLCGDGTEAVEVPEPGTMAPAVEQDLQRDRLPADGDHIMTLVRKSFQSGRNQAARVAHAKWAFQQYKSGCAGTENLTCFFTDLLHVAHREGWNFDLALTLAKQHLVDETNGT